MSGVAAAMDAIRADYREAVRHPAHRRGPWLTLLVLRESTLTARYGRETVDAALRALINEPDVWIEPQPIRSILSPTERRAAVEIGGEDRHLLGINPHL